MRILQKLLPLSTKSQRETKRLEAYYSHWLQPNASSTILAAFDPHDEHTKVDLESLPEKKYQGFLSFCGLQSSSNRQRLRPVKHRNSRVLFKGKKDPKACLIRHLKFKSTKHESYSYAQIFHGSELTCIEFDLKFWETVHCLSLLNRLLNTQLKSVPEFPKILKINLHPSQWRILIYDSLGVKMLLYPLTHQ